MKTCKTIIGVVLVIALLLSVGCAGGGDKKVDTNQSVSTQTKDTPAQTQKDTLKIAYAKGPDTLDCNLTSNNEAERVFANIYGTLLKFDSDYKPQPYIAKSWEFSADGLQCTFHLRDDVKFHNGKKLTAKDVVYSFQKVQQSSFNGAFLTPVDKFEAVDDYTVKLSLKAPYGPLLNVMCEPLCGIVDSEAYETSMDSFKTKPISCGPYKVVELIPDNKLVLERFDEFFGGPAPIKKIDIMFIPDVSTMAIALEKGEVDAAEGISTNNRENIMANKKLNFFEAPATKYYHLAFNNQNEKLKDIKVRQAISYAINKKAVIGNAMDGVGKEAVCTVSEACFGFPANFSDYEYDPNKAKALLKEAGKEGLKFDIYISFNDLNKKIAETLQSDLNAAGFDVAVKIMERPGFVDAVGKGNFDVAVLSWSDSLMDADATVAYRFDRNFTGMAGNWSWIMDDKLMKYVVDARSTVDEQKRKDTYKEMFQYVKDQAFEKPLFFPMNNVGASKDLKVKGASPTGIYYYNEWTW